MRILQKETHRTDSIAVLTSSRKGYYLVVHEGVMDGSHVAQSKHIPKETVYNVNAHGYSLLFLLDGDGVL